MCLHETGTSYFRVMSFNTVQLWDKDCDGIWPPDQESKENILPGGREKKPDENQI